MPRIIALDYKSDGSITKHESGSPTDYADWAAFIAANSLSDVEIINDQRRNLSTSDGGGNSFKILSAANVAPLTSKPVQGATKRDSGNGCLNCLNKPGCLSLVGIRNNLTDRHGIQCGSYSAAS